MIHVHIDNLKLSKSDSTSLLFSIYLQFDQLGAIGIPGWRFKGGYVSPPASKVGSTWFPSVYISEAVGEAIYKALKTVDFTPYPSVELPQKDIVQVRSMMNDDVEERLFPNIKKKKVGRV